MGDRISKIALLTFHRSPLSECDFYYIEHKQDTYQRQQRAPQIDISHGYRRCTPRMLYKPEDKCIIRSGIIF